MKINIYVKWDCSQVMSDVEALNYIAHLTNDYFRNEYFYNKWLNENYTCIELQSMTDEDRADDKKKFQEECMRWAKGDFEYLWDKKEIEI